MVKNLQHLRDFLNEEQMKWLPGNLQVENCMLLTQNKTKDGIFHKVVQVFTSSGTWIGEITEPDFIPSKN